MGKPTSGDAQFKIEIEKAKLAMNALNLTGADRIALIANLIRSNNGTEEMIQTESSFAKVSDDKPAPVATPVVKSGPTGRTVALAPKKAQSAPVKAPTLVKVQCSFQKDGAICPNMVEIDETLATMKVGDKIVSRKIFCDEHRHPCEGGCKKLIPCVHKFCKQCGPQKTGTDKPAPKSAKAEPAAPKTPLPCRGWYRAENGKQITCGTLTTNHGQICDGCRILCKGGCGKLIPHWHDLCPGCNSKKEKATPVTDSKIGTKVELPDGPEEGAMERACWADDTSSGRRNNQQKCGRPTTSSSGLCEEHLHECKGCGQDIPLWHDYCRADLCQAKKLETSKPQPKQPSEATIIAQNEAREATEKDAKRRQELEVAIADKLSKFVADADTVVKMTARIMKKYGDLLTADDALKTAALNKQLSVEGEGIDPTAWIYAQAFGFTEEKLFLVLVGTERQAKAAKVAELADKKGKLTYGAVQHDIPSSVKHKDKQKKDGSKGGKKK